MADRAYRGTYVIPWTQTIIEGLTAESLYDLQIGVTWEWRGRAHRVDGPDDVLMLGDAIGERAFRARVAKATAKRLGRTEQNTMNRDEVEVWRELDDSGFVVTNGAQRHVASVVFPESGSEPLVVFYDGLPQKNTEHWVAEQQLPADIEGPELGASRLVCFSAGTQIATPDGTRDAADLRSGDLVLTKDNGPQPLLWTQKRHVSSVRMQAMPWMRPVRIRAGALGVDIPDGDLIVSARHKMLIKSQAASTLFFANEVLVAAEDLIDGRGVTQELIPGGVTYCHLLLEQHQILFANGVETESFHPSDADLDALLPDDRSSLESALRTAGLDVSRYGMHARRTLTRPEAALLRYEAA